MKSKLITLMLLVSGVAYGQIIPTPRSQVVEQTTFTIDSATMICYSSELSDLVDYLKEYIPVEVQNDNYSSDNAIALSVDNSLAEEAYTLDVTPTHIAIVGGSYGGAFNGVQSLLQTLDSQVYTKSLTLPLTVQCQTVEDEPRYPFRGVMLDIARTWIDLEDLQRQIDLMAYHKLNKLHIHLTDDEGWRIEIKSHPELAKVGGFRGGDSPIESIYGKWGERYGGYLTQDEVRELIAYAAKRNVEIIPEIDLPGHSRTMALLHPEILCNYEPNLSRSNGYDLRSAWCATKESNYEFLEEILAEVCELFPSKHIHIGGDEVRLDQWSKCPDCSAYAREHNFTDMHHLQDYFMARTVEILEKYGKQPAAWNEATNGGDFTHEALIFGWQDVKCNLTATAQGYDCVVMPGSFFYFDMQQSVGEVGHNWAGIFDAERTYSFDPEDQGFSADQIAKIKGFEGALWNENYVNNNPETSDFVDYMLYPRSCSLAEIAWGHSQKDWGEFYEKLSGVHFDRLNAMGVVYRMFPPTLNYEDGKLTVSYDKQTPIYYTDDGYSIPTTESKRYTEPIATTQPHLYAFKAIEECGATSPLVTTESYHKTIHPKFKLTTSMGESKTAPYANVERYQGHAFTLRSHHDGDWILYSFDQAVECRELYLRTGYSHIYKPIFTTADVEISMDGVTYTKLGELKGGNIQLQNPPKFKYIKITATTNGNGWDFVVVQPPRIKAVM